MPRSRTGRRAAQSLNCTHQGASSSCIRGLCSTCCSQQVNGGCELCPHHAAAQQPSSSSSSSNNSRSASTSHNSTTAASQAAQGTRQQQQQTHAQSEQQQQQQQQEEQAGPSQQPHTAMRATDRRAAASTPVPQSVAEGPLTVWLGWQVVSTASSMAPLQPPLWWSLVVVVLAFSWQALLRLAEVDPGLISHLEPSINVGRVVLLHWLVLVHGGVVRQCEALFGFSRIAAYCRQLHLFGTSSPHQLFRLLGMLGDTSHLEATLVDAVPHLCRFALDMVFGFEWRWVWVLWVACAMMTAYTTTVAAVSLPAAPVVPEQRLLWVLYGCYALVAARPVYRGLLRGPVAQVLMVRCMMPTILEVGYPPGRAMRFVDAIWGHAAEAARAATHARALLSAVQRNPDAANNVMIGFFALVGMVCLGCHLAWQAWKAGIDALTAVTDAVWSALAYVVTAMLSGLFQAVASSLRVSVAWLQHCNAVAWQGAAAVRAAVSHAMNAMWYAAVAVSSGRRSASAVPHLEPATKTLPSVPSVAHTFHTAHISNSRSSNLHDAAKELLTPSSGPGGHNPAGQQVWVLLAGMLLGIAAVLTVQFLWATRLSVMLQRWRAYRSSAQAPGAAPTGRTQAAAGPGVVFAAAGSGIQGQSQHAWESMESGNECVVCHDATRSICLRPCGHVVLCEACFDMITQQARRATAGGHMICPICREEVKRHERGLKIV